MPKRTAADTARKSCQTNYLCFLIHLARDDIVQATRGKHLFPLRKRAKSFDLSILKKSRRMTPDGRIQVLSWIANHIQRTRKRHRPSPQALAFRVVSVHSVLRSIISKPLEEFTFTYKELDLAFNFLSLTSAYYLNENTRQLNIKVPFRKTIHPDVLERIQYSREQHGQIDSGFTLDGTVRTPCEFAKAAVCSLRHKNVRRAERRIM